MNSISDSSKPHGVADALGLGSLADGEVGMDPEILRAVYRHARSEDGKRVLLNDISYARGWIDLSTPEAARLISAFVPLDDPNDVKRAKNIAAANLEAQSWNDVLGIDHPPMKCVVRIKGSRWGLRFQSLEPSLKGREVINEQLPAIPGNAPAIPPPELPSASQAPCQAGITGETDLDVMTSTAEEVLRLGGMP